jgi:hypothetical protein
LEGREESRVERDQGREQGRAEGKEGKEQGREERKEEVVCRGDRGGDIGC